MGRPLGPTARGEGGRAKVLVSCRTGCGLAALHLTEEDCPPHQAFAQALTSAAGLRCFRGASCEDWLQRPSQQAPGPLARAAR